MLAYLRTCGYDGDEDDTVTTLYVRGVPQQVYEELKQFAETDGQSVNKEALTLIEQGIAQRRIALERREALAGLDALRRRIGPTRGDSLELLREDRAR